MNNNKIPKLKLESVFLLKEATPPLTDLNQLRQAQPPQIFQWINSVLEQIEAVHYASDRLPDAQMKEKTQTALEMVKTQLLALNKTLQAAAKMQMPGQNKPAIIVP